MSAGSRGGGGAPTSATDNGARFARTTPSAVTPGATSLMTRLGHALTAGGKTVSPV